MSKHRAVIVDDDVDIAHLIRECLREEGFEVTLAATGSVALQVIEKKRPEVVILDIMLPDFDGFKVLQRLRQWSQVPVIALSARGEMTYKTKCLNLGADDYMTKPFGVEELLARVRAVLRRTRVVDSAPATPLFCSGNLQINFAERRVTIAGNEISLTPIEYDLLKELTTNVGKVLNYSHLLHKVWGPEYGSEREYLHVYIGYLRGKIEPDPTEPKHIITVSGVGYRFQLKE